MEEGWRGEKSALRCVALRFQIPLTSLCASRYGSFTRAHEEDWGCGLNQKIKCDADREGGNIERVEGAKSSGSVKKEHHAAEAEECRE